MIYICPKCKAALSLAGACVRCPSGHSYDRSRQGYYNLLLSGGGGVHGDNKEMVKARTAFLDGGYYLPLANEVARLCRAYTTPRGVLLDAGCGEGYYTDLIERALYERDGETSVSAFDISKDAVKAAARRNPRLSLAVASSYAMPVKDGSVDTVVNIFSPLALDEVRRVLSRDGVFIMAYPGVDHLLGLKRAIYDTPYKNEPQDTSIVGFDLLETVMVEYDLSLDSGEAIESLFMMTPYAYRTSKLGRERVRSLERLVTEIRFIVGVYRKNR